MLRECLGLRARGHEVALICQPQAALARRAAAAGLPVWLIPLTGQVSVASALRVHRALHDLRPAVLHTHSSIDGWMGAYLKRVHGYRLVRTRHIEMPVRNLLAYRACDHLVTTGAATRARFLARGFAPDRVSFIPTGIEPHTAAPADLHAACGWPAHLPLVGTVSVLRSWKGHQLFIAAAEALCARGLDAGFIIAGDGPQRPVLEARLAQSPHRDRIRLLGHREDAAAVLAALAVLAHPSTGGEGVPQAVLQAWAQRVPVVATRIPNVAELVSDGQTGLLVAPGDSAALADAIARLLADAPLRQRLGAAGHDEALHRYTWQTTLDRLEDVYRAVAA